MLSLIPEREAGRPLQVLCLGAHSDDIEIGCGGTILRMVAEAPEAEFRWVVFGADKPERKREAVASAGLFLDGAWEKNIVVRDFRESFFPYEGSAIKEFFEEQKASFAPDLIFTHCRNDLHQDHRLICDLTWNTFRNHLILEYEIPKYDGDLGAPNVFVPLDAHTAERKVAHLMQVFESQRSKHWFTVDLFKALMRVRGLESASLYAEAFYGRKLSLEPTSRSGPAAK